LKKSTTKKMFDKRSILFVLLVCTVVITGILISKVLCDLETEVNRNEGIKIFQQAMTLIRKNYVEDVQPKELMHNAIKGMIGSLDPHSASMTPEELGQMQLGKTGVIINTLFDAAETSDNGNEEAKIFKEALTLVRKNYAEDVQQDTQPKDLIYGAIKGAIDSLDPHSAFMTPEQFEQIQLETEGKFGGIGIQIGMKNDIITVIDTLEGTPAYRAGIKKGDHIIKINSEVTKHMTLTDAVSKMRGTPSTKLRITILRDGGKETGDLTIIREAIQLKSIKATMLEDNIGYIKINQFQQETASDFSTALSKLMNQNMHSLIIDLRNNPGGLLQSAVKVASEFIPPGKLVVFTKNKKGQQKEYRSSKNNPDSRIPIVVLVNEGSASASEILAGALKDWERATIMGTLTFGKGSVQTIVPLTDGSALKLTTARYYTPKGISIQTTGISPDIPVKPLIKKGQQVYPVTVTREKDLEGHLTNGQTEDVMTSEDIVLITMNDDEDQQLQRAIVFLKNKAFQIASPDIPSRISGRTM